MDAEDYSTVINIAASPGLPRATGIPLSPQFLVTYSPPPLTPFTHQPRRTATLTLSHAPRGPRLSLTSPRTPPGAPLPRICSRGLPPPPFSLGGVHIQQLQIAHLFGPPQQRLYSAAAGGGGARGGGGGAAGVPGPEELRSSINSVSDSNASSMYWSTLPSLLPTSSTPIIADVPPPLPPSPYVLALAISRCSCGWPSCGG